MAESAEWKTPLSWNTEGFTLDDYDLVFLPGGHEKSVRQVIDSKDVHRLLIDFFPKTKKQPPPGSSDSHGKKVVGAVCHGVMCLSEARDADGRSPIHQCATTALPTRFEQVAFWGTRAFLGDYYKTYGAGSENVEQSVSQTLSYPSISFLRRLPLIHSPDVGSQSLGRSVPIQEQLGTRSVSQLSHHYLTAKHNNR